MRLIERLLGRPALPAGLAGSLDPDEHVLAVAVLPAGEMLTATSHGIWLPERRRVGWHLVSRAGWADGLLTLVEAGEEPAGAAVLLTDLPPRRLRLTEPGKVPEVVRRRVDDSIRTRHHRELPGGGAWFVQRKVAGRDGFQLQVRADPGTDLDVVRRVAAEVAAALPPPPTEPPAGPPARPAAS